MVTGRNRRSRPLHSPEDGADYRVPPPFQASTRPGRRPAETGRAARRRDVSPTLLLKLPLLLVLVVSVGWALRLESELPELRLSRQGTSDIAGSSLFPGSHAVLEPEINREGEWYEQRLGDETFLVSETQESSLSFRFYGTDVDLMTRVGPEAGRLYVSVDGRPVSGLSQDEQGSYTSLRDLQAQVTLVRVASGLAHREHEIVLLNGGNDELAFSGVVISARTPFAWAFAMLYVALALAIFVTIRTAAFELAGFLGWLPDRDSLAIDASTPVQ